MGPGVWYWSVLGLVGPGGGAGASLGAARSFDLPAAVARLGMPVLVATGDHDPNLASSRRIVAAAPDASLVVMKNVGHGSVLQRPDLAAATFTNFHAGLALN